MTKSLDSSKNTTNRLVEISKVRHNVPSLTNCNVKVLLDKDAVVNYFKTREKIKIDKRKDLNSNESNRQKQTTILTFFKKKSLVSLDNNHNVNKSDVESKCIKKESTTSETLSKPFEKGQGSIKHKPQRLSNPPDFAIKLMELYCTKCHKTHKIRMRNNLKNCLDCNGSLLFRCIKCDRTVNKFVPMLNHTSSICDGYLFFNCHHCDYVGGGKDVIRKHLQRMHSRVEKDYLVCAQCKRGFKCMAYLTKHTRTCSLTKKLLKCSFCPYESNSQQLYMKHLKTHMSQPRKKNTKEISDGNNLSSEMASTILPVENELIVDDNDNMSAQVRILPPQMDYAPKKDPMVCKLAEYWCKKCEIKEKVTSVKPVNCRTCKKQMLFRCKLCTRLYQSNSAFLAHLKNTCSPSKYYFCHHCNQKYNIKNNLLRHIFSKHMKNCKPFINTKKSFKCFKCSRKYSKKLHLIYHVKLCGIPKLFKCQFCSMDTQHKTSLRGHMKIKHKHIGEERREKILNDIAKVANAKIKENYKKIKHLVEEPEPEENENMEGAPNAVNIYSKHLYKNEWKSALPMMQFYCTKCKHVPEIKRPLPNRCVKCKAALKFKCLECLREYSSLKGLLPHIKLKHLLSKEQQKLYQCSKCTSCFNFYYDLKHHWKTCMKTVPDMKCDHCNFATKQRLTLIGHIQQRHMGIKRKTYFKCEGCYAKFEDVTVLEKHWKGGCDVAVFGFIIAESN